MTALKEYIKFNHNFKKAVNLYLDLNKEDRVNDYIPTKSSINILNTYLTSVETNREHSTILIGPYGKGKSHLLLVLLSILSMKRTAHNQELIDNIAYKIQAIDTDASKRIQSIFCNKGRFLPVIIMSSNGDLNSAFQVGLNEALKREGLENIAPETFFSSVLNTIQRWKEDYPDTFGNFQNELKAKSISYQGYLDKLKNYDKESLELFREIYPALTSGSMFNPLIDSEILPMYKNVADQLVREYGYSGIYIIFDEFSKFIEGQDDIHVGNNMKLLQDICELANSSQSTQIFVTLVAHKSIREYGNYLSRELINSFTGIEGRLKEIFFITSSKNNYELIGNAIEKDIKKLKNMEKVQRVLDMGKKSYFSIPVFSAVFTKEDFEKTVVDDCYPLTPVSAYLLLNISEKVAQNERTLFTFISNNEKYSMSDCISHLPNATLWGIFADAIYDYFKGDFKKEIQNEFIHNEWLNAEYALSITNSREEIRFIKALAIINIVNKTDELPANALCLKYASGVEDLDIVIRSLEQKDIIYKRNSSDTYVFKTRATAELKKEIKRRKALLSSNINISSVLNQISEVRYVLPRQYNYEHAMTRYFNYEYMEISDFLNIPNLNDLMVDGEFCDGKIVALYSIDRNDYSQNIYEKLRSNCPENLIIQIGEKPFDRKEQALEYVAIQYIKKDNSYLDQNKVFKKELLLIEGDIEQNLCSYINESFSEAYGSNQLYYRYKNNLTTTKVKSLHKVVDEVCASLYDRAIYINNELINKKVIKTTPIKKVRKNLIERILHGDSMDEYLAGTSADATIFRAVFKNTGIWDNNINDLNLVNVLHQIDTFIDSAGNQKLPMITLIDELEAPPIGMRRGVIPLFFAYSLSQRNEDIIIYFGNKEINIDANIIINMCEEPKEYSLFVSAEDLKKEAYLSEIAKLFFIEDKILKKDTRLSFIIQEIQRWFRALPQVTKNIKNQTGYLKDKQLENAIPYFKKLMHKIDINPYEAIFITLPEICDAKSDYKECVEFIKTLKIKLANFYDYLLSQIAAKTKDIFCADSNLGLSHILQEWYSMQSYTAQNGLQSSDLSAFMTFIHETKSFDDNAYAEKLAHVVVGIYVDSWNDKTFDEYLEKLQLMKQEAESIGDDCSNQFELSFTGSDGKQIKKYYNPVDEGTGAILRNIITDALEDFSDISVNDRIAILLEMIENQLK